jgi:hypothetical protein
MSKIVKLKLSDIENIVRKTIKESEFDDFDTNIQPEELPGAQDYEDQMSDEPEQKESTRNIAIGKGEDGKIYVTDVESGEILGVK